MSETDIDKGARGLDEMGKALSEIKLGVVCLTPENLESHWILYEAGALSKTLDVKTRLCTLLLGGLEPNDVKQPLGIFQHTRATKEETKQLVKTINTAINEEPLPDSIVDKLFEPLWPDLEKTLKSMPHVPKPPAKRSVEDMVYEMLDMMRAERGARAAELEQLVKTAEITQERKMLDHERHALMMESRHLMVELERAKNERAALELERRELEAHKSSATSAKQAKGSN